MEGDIQAFFATSDQQKLMRLLRRRSRAKQRLSLIWKFLRAGIMEPGNLRHSVLGTPQGGIVSPLLAHLFRSERDRQMERYTELPSLERPRRNRQQLANCL